MSMRKLIVLDCLSVSPTSETKQETVSGTPEHYKKAYWFFLEMLVMNYSRITREINFFSDFVLDLSAVYPTRH